MATSRTLTSITPSSANDKSFRLSQTPQNYTVSVMSSSGGRCYKAACPSGYYLEKPNDTYFTVGSATGTVSGVVCYKATGCQMVILPLVPVLEAFITEQFAKKMNVNLLVRMKIIVIMAHILYQMAVAEPVQNVILLVELDISMTFPWLIVLSDQR